MSFQGKALGRWGEQQAASYLQGQGYRLCQLNYRCPVGEVDLIVRRGGVIAFVEVKTRRHEAWGAPAEAVGRTKQRQLWRCAQWYLQQLPVKDEQIRFDVVAVYVRDGQQPCIEHIEAAFGEGF